MNPVDWHFLLNMDTKSEIRVRFIYSPVVSGEFGQVDRVGDGTVDTKVTDAGEFGLRPRPSRAQFTGQRTPAAIHPDAGHFLATSTC